MIDFTCPQCHSNLADSHRTFLCFACRTSTTALPRPLDMCRQAMAKVDDDDEDDDAPKKKKPEKAKGGGISMGLIIAIVGVLLVCCICFPAGGGVGVYFMYQGVGGAQQRVQTMNDLKHIGLAMHAHHDMNGRLPPPRAFKGDLSWRVAVLPHIEQGNLFRQFDVNKSWDQPPNQQMLSQRPKTYQSALHPAPDASSTPYQYFVGPNSLFPQQTTTVKLGAIKDGTSNTILVAESKSPVPWSKSADMNTVGVLMVPADRYVICLADGSVKTVNPARVSEANLRLLIHPEDGKVVPIDLE
jgi:hypothetical protein